MEVRSKSDSVWPARDDYQNAVLHPERNLKDPRLHSARVETKRLGPLDIPFPRSGNFGAVYKFGNQRHTYAVKIFDKAQPDRQQRYQLIHQHLEGQRNLRNTPLVSFSYEPEGILVNRRRYPTLVMDWVEGQLLDEYLAETLHKKGQVENGALCQAWVELLHGLHEGGIAHGDLQHGNILVMPDGTLKLVDYDGMFVPAMRQAGLTAAEIGLPAYQHPKRFRGYFDERLDDFAALVILLSLACVDVDLWQTHHTDDNCLIVRERDLVQPEQSVLLGKLSQSIDAPVKKLAAMLKVAAKGSLNNIPRFATVTKDTAVKQLVNFSWRPTRRHPLEKKPEPLSSSPKCARCRVELLPGDRFCRKCGNPVAGKSKEPLKPNPVESELTLREKEILSFVAADYSDARIAEKLFIKEDTVGKHITKMEAKLGLTIRKDLIAWAKGHGIKPPEEKPPPSTLTPGDEFVLSYLSGGATDDQIAQILSVETGSARSYIADIQRKVGVLTRADLINWAMRNGIKSRQVELVQEKVGEIRRFTGHTHVVRSVVFSPDGRTILSGSFDGTIRLWDVEDGREIRRFEGHGGWFSSSSVLAVAFSPDGHHFVSGGGDKTARLWQAETGQELRRLKGHGDVVMSVAFSSDGRHVLSSSKDKTIRLWNTETGQQLQCLTGHSEMVTGVTFSHDGRHIVSASSDRTIRLWNIESGKEIRRFEGHTNMVLGVVFSPDGRNILSGSSDHTVRLWDMSTGKEIRRFQRHEGEVTSVAFSPDGRRLLSASLDQTIRLWDVGSGTMLHYFYFTANGEPFWSVAFSPDGHRAVSGNGGKYNKEQSGWDPSNDHNVRLWRLPHA